MKYSLKLAIQRMALLPQKPFKDDLERFRNSASLALPSETPCQAVQLDC